MDEDIKLSYASANVFPAKLLHNEQLLRATKIAHKIPIIHLQLNPTNRCNFNCPFCSCSARNRNLELSVREIEDIMKKAKTCGCQSVTITGGGEPLLHPEINEIISEINDLGIEIGIVTNGTPLKLLTDASLKRIVWIRISSSDYLQSELKKIGKNTDKWLNEIADVIKRSGNIDWAFSHVVSERPDFELIRSIVEFANKHFFTHIRLVNNILLVDHLKDQIWQVKQYLKEKMVDDTLVNYQDRSEWTKGTPKCYISILKPVIGADGWIYPCCGNQYSLENPSRDYEKSMRMGKAKDINKIWENQEFFDGSNCVKCYYHQYNWALGVLLSNLKHSKFV